MNAYLRDHVHASILADLRAETTTWGVGDEDGAVDAVVIDTLALLVLCGFMD